jgi:putative FmdB family regulatory protein
LSLPRLGFKADSILRRTILPIYAYRCASCGFEKDVLQKLSDPILTQCPSCHAETFQKQVTAAGFQLKGSGWYATDFRNPPAKAPAAADPAAPTPASPAAGETKSDSKGGGSNESAGTTGTAAKSDAAPTPTPNPSSPAS